MAHPKSKISKSRRDKRRTHKKLTPATTTTCPNTGEVHRMHTAYWHEGSMYYNGNLVIAVEAEIED